MRLLSWLLLAAGAFFLVSGARELLIPILGQREVSRAWNSPPPPNAPQAPALPDLGGAVCRLLIPRLDAHLFVVEGTDKHDLRIGPGHMEGTALPGQAGNCIIAGHRDTHFRILKDLRKGDDIVLQTRAGEFHYTVKKMSVVSPRDTKPLQTTPAPVLSLITCYPFYYVGPAPKRFVVEAELAGTPPASAQASPPPTVEKSTPDAAPKQAAARTKHPARRARTVLASSRSRRRASVSRKRGNVVSRLFARILKRRHATLSDPIIE